MSEQRTKKIRSLELVNERLRLDCLVMAQELQRFSKKYIVDHRAMLVADTHCDRAPEKLVLVP